MSEFLAEAQVLIRPNTTAFQATLLAEVNAAITAVSAIAKPVIVPVQVVTGAAGAAGLAVANEEAAAAARLAAAESTRAAAATRELGRQQTLASKSATTLAVAQSEVVGASSAAAAAAIAFGRSEAALAAANAELAAALRLRNLQMEIAAGESVRLAEAQHAEALTALEAARAQVAHGAALAQVNKAGIAGAASMLGLRGAVLTAGAAFLGATIGLQSFARAVGLSRELERTLAVFRVTAGATADEMARVSEQAKALGRDITLPGVAAQDAATAMTELSKAGLSVADSIDAARGTLQLATAAQIDNAQATELVANALNAFSLDGEEATRVADLLAGAANASQGSITDMGIALRQSAGAASQIGLSLDETVSLLTALARSGLAGSDAGTTLRVALLRLVAPTAAANAELERFNITLRDSLSGDVRVEALFELEAALKKVSRAEADRVRVAVFGQNAFRVSSFLGRLTTQEFLALEEAVTQAGQAEELAAAQTEGLGGDVEGAKNEFAALGTTLGQVSSGPLSLFVRTAGQAAGAINDVVTEIEAADQGLGETLGNFFNRFSESFARMNLSFQQGVRGARDFNAGLVILDATARTVDDAITGLSEALEEFGSKAQAALPKDSGLSGEQVSNRLLGFDAAETRARISGSNAAILAVLQEEQAFLEGQLERGFIKRRTELRRKLEAALLGVVNDIDAIQREGVSAAKSSAADAKRRAEELARARREADDALLEALGLRREDIERRIGIAADSGNVQAQLRRMDNFQRVLRIQIKKVQDLIEDEKLRKATVRLLRIALAESRREEEALRAEQLANAVAEREESIRLLIENAQITGNRAKEIALQKKLVKDLERQVRESKLRGNKLQELKNELARERKRLKELQGETQDTANSFRELQFEFMQSQQGFAANLISNLIPAGAIPGLVGGTVPSPNAQVAQASAFADARGSTTTQGQTALTIEILRQMLGELRAIRAGRSHPEAARQASSGSVALEMM